MKKDHRDIHDEFSEFIEGPSINPPSSLDNRVLSEILERLNPGPWLVFSKLSLLHLIVGLFTLSICPQFGINILGVDLGLLKVFYQFGTYGCVTACGALFIGTTSLLALIVLRKEEIKKIRQMWLLQLAAISLLSIGFFIMLNAVILWSFAVFWIIGGLLGGLITLETGISFQKKFFA